MNKQLLVVIELGGYPNFVPLYKSLGYDVTMVTSVRNAIRSLKKIKPQAVVAEFNFQSDFRDRTSSLESLLSTVQTLNKCDVVVFYETEHAHQLEKLTRQYPIHTLIPFPIDEEKLREAMQNIMQAE
ncbi:MAG: hypothetical protein PVG20_08255 [Thioalkalispiraceae bacterium]|jgi:hypothetical protein